MNCPVCNLELQLAERQGVEIDYCAKCRGVWLDRGELDKIIDRSAGGGPLRTEDDRDRRGMDRRRDDDDRYDQDPRRRKREGFLGELFDF